MRKQNHLKNKIRANHLAITVLASSLLAVVCLFWKGAMAQPQGVATPATPQHSAPQVPKQQEEADPMAAIEKLLQQGGTANSDFVYQREGRPDPFFPFLTQQPQKGEASGELAGMQRFEPGQLRLVAIVHSRKGPVAMVQDSAGIGYTLRKGSRVGRNGEVVDIVGNKVIIRQEAFSTTKEKQYRTTEMVLTKEGDKKP